MTSAEIVKALRCTATVQTGDELCASCPFDRAETLTEEQKVQLHCEEWHSCDVDGKATLEDKCRCGRGRTDDQTVRAAAAGKNGGQEEWQNVKT